MTAGPITCAACGAKLRSDRRKCLRCGAPVVAGPDGARGMVLTTLLASAGVVAIGGFAFIFVRGVPAELTAPVRAILPASAASRPAPAPVVAASPAAAASAVVLDENRAAAAAYARGDVAGSIEALTKAVDADPQNALALNNLGQALVRAGRAQEALPYFDRALAISDSTWAYHFNRAKAYEALAQWSQAVGDYRQAADLFPDDYATQFNLAKTLQESGDLSSAIDAYARAIQLAPGQADFHLSHAQALEQAGRPADAVTAYRAYLDLEPDSPDADKIKARIAQLEGAPAPPPASAAATAAAAASTLAADRTAAP